VWTLVAAVKKEVVVACTHIAKNINGQHPKKMIRCQDKDMQNRLRKLSENRAAEDNYIHCVLYVLKQLYLW